MIRLLVDQPDIVTNPDGVAFGWIVMGAVVMVAVILWIGGGDNDDWTK